MSFFNDSLKTHKKIKPGFFIVYYIDLTKNRVGGILREEEVPEHRVISTFLAKSRPTFSTHRAALFFTLFYRVGRRVLIAS